ncbi:unnamed protein product [Diatraea saccharalis]|uniref:Aspartyl/asparaginy/proline hydroxylase domain-containing protein n=1 Tax=Diatraea saccharalis TaxID=40085 RepID=A0A9N9RHL6_9NEOP|nr:unnamed protein product [Diatraea saccharalis]
MSGDVQPRKRKDKKRKKDDLGVEEPRGTAAALGEGDVFMHSHHEHGTGGHWCAKIIFFSLLAVLITLIGLIILENRGLSELEANAVESRYSGVLEGWLEDAPDDDHHDEHTLELTHHDDDEEHHEANHLEDENHDEVEDDDHDEDEDNDQDDDERIEQSDEDDDDEELDNDENDGDDDEYGLDKDEDDNEQQDLDDEDEEHDFYSDKKKTIYDESEDNGNKDDLNDGDESGEENQPDDEDNEDSHEENYYGQYEVDENDRDHIDDDDDESNEIDNAKYENSIENNDDDDNDQNLEDSNENNNEDDEEHEEDHDSAEEEVEVEKLETEEPDEEAISTELPSLPEDNDDDNGVTDDKNDDGDLSEAESDQEEFDNAEEEDEYLENDDIEEPEVEPITALPGKPLPEVEEEISSEQPPDTLAEEEEYEKRQEELRREEEQSSHNALDDEEPAITEDIPLSDRRLTLIPEEHSKSVKKILEEISERSFDKVVGSADNSGKPALVKKQESEDEEKYSDEEEIQDSTVTAEDNKELYSDDEQPEDDEEVVEEPKQIIKQSAPLVESKATHEPEGDEELEEDDVEIIDDEQLEEELEEEDEEEISDVDDAELLTRLEAKYGKLPEPERPGQKHYSKHDIALVLSLCMASACPNINKTNKDGGNSIDDVWPGEPSDAYWRDQLDSAERDLLQGEWSVAVERASSDRLRDSARARWIAARALDHAAEARRDNSLLSRAITAYLHLLKMNERLSDEKLLKISERVLDRIQFRGNYLNAEPVYRLLIRRFPNDPAYRNNLTISYLMANRADLAEDSIKETLKRWPNDRLALAHYGFVLKTRHNRYEEAAQAFSKALDGDTGPANEARFYYHYGDSLLLLGRFAEAHEVHKRGAALGHFLSPAQRSLYNVPRLKSSPWWKIEETPYLNLAKALEKSWREILKEAEAAKSLYEKEKEGLKERGEWSQLDLFARGREIPDRCKRAPVTCSIVKGEIAAVGCRRGQIKFSAMEAGTHVRPHVGPTNCRLRMHLGLSNTKDTYIRVDQELRQWREGKTLMFDDSFEHEVWHNGTGTRLVLIVDVWHPHLTPAERRQLPAI